jgi:hypothetical protein
MRQKPSAYQSTNNSNRNVGDESKSGALNDLACEPTRDQANKQNDNYRLPRHRFPSPVLT